jgi:hypothetical protein
VNVSEVKTANEAAEKTPWMKICVRAPAKQTAEKACGKVFPSRPARGVLVEPNRENDAASEFPAAANLAGNFSVV